ncbi:MAG TPA: SCO family protein [Bryobacteraceae bacterium]|jgi:protein SCO1/2
MPVLLLFEACSDPASRLPDYGTVPPFTMVDSQGRHFDSQELNGKVWIADFIYTNCPAACPFMSSRLRSVQRALRGKNDVQLVSISVDPARDTPTVLNAFARSYGAPNSQWIFLTGTPETVHLLAYQTFHVGDVLGKIEHSTKFALVDKHANIRGYYSTYDKDGIPALLKDVSALRRARS